MRIDGGLRRTSNHVLVIALAILATILTAPWVSANAARLITLHSFCSKRACADGSLSTTNLLLDQAGNLFGTTANNGTHAEGVVFEMIAGQSGQPRRYKVLYDFCDANGCTDGSNPGLSTLIIDTAGNLYGATVAGGAANDGTVFELSPKPNSNRWTLRVLYNFCARQSDCRDGSQPSGGLTYAGAQAGTPYDGVSPLYGVASAGGYNFGGVAYSLTPTQGTQWSEKVLYAFCGQGGVTCTDGVSPSAGLTMDATGNLYGVTSLGGNSSQTGVAFKLTPQQGQTKWLEVVLHSFCSAAPNCSDGASPLARLTIDANGNVFGATYLGGNSPAFANCCGVVYEITPDGSESVIHSFCLQGGENCTDGGFPIDTGGLFLDQTGDLFGTTERGGASNILNRGGTLFELTPGTGQSKILYSFCVAGDPCVDGFQLGAGVIMDQTGRLFGSATSGGGNGYGTVFEWK